MALASSEAVPTTRRLKAASADCGNLCLTREKRREKERVRAVHSQAFKDALFNKAASAQASASAYGAGAVGA